MHGLPMSNGAAGELALSQGTGDGTFFLRPRDGHPNDFVLCVVYKGKPTHHLVAEIDGGWTVNKKKYGDYATIDEMVTALGSGTVARWPVPLKHAVAATAPATADKNSGDVDVNINSRKAEGWYHQRQMSKDESSALVLDAGTTDGTFLVYDHSATGHVLCVVFKDKPTHHLITEVDGKLVVNKRSYVDATTLEELVAALAQPGVPKWPVPLTRPVRPPKEDHTAAARAAREKAREEDAAAAATRATAATSAAAAAEVVAAAVTKEEEETQREAAQATAKAQMDEEAAQRRLEEEKAAKEKEIAAAAEAAAAEAAAAEAAAAEAAAAEAERLRRTELFSELNEAAMIPLYQTESVPEEARPALDAARDEVLESLTELEALLADVDVFKADGLIPAVDAWSELTADESVPTLGQFLMKFGTDVVRQRRALVDPEFAAEERAKRASAEVAAKRREEQELATSTLAREKAAAEVAAQKAAEEAAADEAMIASLPKWRQEKLKKDRAAATAAAASEAITAAAVPIWQQALLDEKRAKQEKAQAVEQAKTKGAKTLLIVREEKERQERQELEERQRQLQEEKEAADSARRAQEQAEKDKLEAEERAKREEEEKIRAMPPWKRAVYLKRKERAAKGGDGGANTTGGTKSFALADSVLEVLKRRKAALAEEEAEAERKANAARASDTVTRAWGALGAGTPKESPVNRAPATNADALKATVGMFKMKKLQQIQEGDTKKKKMGTWGRSKITMLESLEASEELEAATKAAAMIARVWRAKVARKKVAGLRLEKKQAKEAAAATKIQSKFRGHKTRKEIKALQAKREEQARADAEAAEAFAQKEAKLRAIMQQRHQLALERQALIAMKAKEQENKSRKKSRKRGVKSSHGRTVTRLRAVDQASAAAASSPEAAEKLRQISERAARLDSKRPAAGSVRSVDSSTGVYIVDGVYVNREGSLAHTAVLPYGLSDA